MSDTSWSVTPKPVPAELVTNPHATYPPQPTRFATIAEQLDTATFDTLRSWANGGIGQPETD